MIKINPLIAQFLPSFFCRSKDNCPASIAELAISKTFKTDQQLPLLKMDSTPLSPVGWSLSSKVQIAALLLFFAHRAATAVTTTAVNVIPSVAVAVLLTITAFQIYQFSMRNFMQNTALNTVALAATVALGPNPTGPTPEDEFDGVVHNMGALGVILIPETDSNEANTPSEVLIDIASAAATVALGPNPTGPTPEDEFDEVVYDMGGIGTFVIHNAQPKKIEIPPSQTESNDLEPNEEVEETSNWAASMGGFFFGFIQVIGFVFLM